MRLWRKPSLMILCADFCHPGTRLSFLADPSDKQRTCSPLRHKWPREAIKTQNICHWSAAQLISRAAFSGCSLCAPQEQEAPRFNEECFNQEWSASSPRSDSKRLVGLIRGRLSEVLGEIIVKIENQLNVQWGRFSHSLDSWSRTAFIVFCRSLQVMNQKNSWHMSERRQTQRRKSGDTHRKGVGQGGWRGQHNAAFNTGDSCLQPDHTALTQLRRMKKKKHDEPHSN